GGGRAPPSTLPPPRTQGPMRPLALQEVGDVEVLLLRVERDRRGGRLEHLLFLFVLQERRHRLPLPRSLSLEDPRQPAVSPVATELVEAGGDDRHPDPVA